MNKSIIIVLSRQLCEAELVAGQNAPSGGNFSGHHGGKNFSLNEKT